MAKLTRDHWWLWGQDANSHHEVLDESGKPVWNLPGVNKMTPEEGGRFFNIPNMCRIGMSGKPEPPFDNEMDKLMEFPKVAFSIIGDNGSLRNDGGGDDVEEVIKLAPKYPNLVAGMMDDFYSPKRKEVYTPEVLDSFAERLHAANLELWSVIYEHQLVEENTPWVQACDMVSTWCWCGSNLEHLEENLAKLRSLMKPGQKLFHGCYMWNYGECCPLTDEQMVMQLDTYKKWIEEDKIDGIILCSNAIEDVGIKAVDITLDWMKKNMED